MPLTMISKKKVVLYKILIVVVTYILLELCCFITIKTRYIPAAQPSFQFVLKNPEYPMVWADIDSIWGNWHYRETFRQQTGCLSFEYRINSYGARDKERSVKSVSTDRVVALGDSFIEGYGIEASSRLTDLLEQKTGKEFLNFGCSDFGTAQEYLVYEHLAKNFEHSTVLIGFLPYNDFENDDTAFMHTDRYKPYYVLSDTGYRLKYYSDQLWKSAMNKDSFRVSSGRFTTVISRFLRAYTYWYNIVDYVRLKDLYTPILAHKNNKTLSYYYDYEPQHLHKLQFILSKLRTSAKNKRIILFTIPTQPDFMRYESDRKPPLPIEINRICKALNIEYLDLMPPMIQQEVKYCKLFLSCDPHWNGYANEIAANILIQKFKF